ncbi:LD-carboxypeptidase [Aquirufa ecclesiirivi]|uniref:LD-carboxypeptidase n=1 Tax=Aquirufa ecclesiirivi TaxID=2715124 RepID=A0ABT4JHB2_9BACT|nr:LD-carboxypeptidase [Aquirufa ecclesiirivi]MCZ2475669.1 LD-carboxypeptidase [Aquirufa ecclesiirivi]NHC48979.1 LD-carboxypeptidase [Aquirufa ecclesiirivi]
MKTPPLLHPGDEVILVSPASHPKSDQWKQGVEVLESWGLKVRLAPNALSHYFGFGGSDEERLSDFQLALDDPKIKAIFPIRGGYGSSRILDRLNFEKFLLNPKWIIGFSDITAILNHVAQLEIASIHGPMPHNFCQVGGDEALESLRNLLFEGKIQIDIPSEPENRIGHAEAEIVGGNLSLIVHLIGSQSLPDFKGKILLLEDVGENLYHIDRMVLQLKRAGLLDHLAGLIVGGFSDCKEAGLSVGKNVNQIILEHTAGSQYPIAFEFPSGHIAQNFPLVFGKKIKLLVNADNVQLTD